MKDLKKMEQAFGELLAEVVTNTESFKEWSKGEDEDTFDFNRPFKFLEVIYHFGKNGAKRKARKEILEGFESNPNRSEATAFISFITSSITELYLGKMWLIDICFYLKFKLLELD